jgi:hypothetical protein
LNLPVQLPVLEAVAAVALKIASSQYASQLAARTADMSRVRVESFSVSIDGYGAGPPQDPANPLGVGGILAALQATPNATHVVLTKRGR